MYTRTKINEIMYDAQNHILHKYGKLEKRETEIVLDFVFYMHKQLREQNKEYVELEKYIEVVNENIQQKHEIDELKTAIRTTFHVLQEDKTNE